MFRTITIYVLPPPKDRCALLHGLQHRHTQPDDKRRSLQRRVGVQAGKEDGADKWHQETEEGAGGEALIVYFSDANTSEAAPMLPALLPRLAAIISVLTAQSAIAYRRAHWLTFSI